MSAELSLSPKDVHARAAAAVAPHPPPPENWDEFNCVEQANASQAHLEGFLAFWPEQFGPGCREDIAGSGQQVSRCYLHRSVRHGPAAHSLVIRWLPLIWNSLGSCHARKRDLQLVAEHYNCTLGVQGYHTL